MTENVSNNIELNKPLWDECESFTLYCQECEKHTTHREVRPDSGCFECEAHTKQKLSK